MSRYRATMSELLQKVHEQDKDHEISMARGELEAIADKATQLASALKGKSDEGNPLEAWVQSKITKAKDYINSVSDYMLYNPDMKQNEETILEKSFTSQQIKQAYGILNDPRYKGGNYDGAVAAIEKLAKGLSKHPDVANALRRANEEVDLDESRMKDIFTANQEGESVEKIAKRLKLSVATVKKLLGLKEEVLDEFTTSMIKDLQKSYADLKGKTISPEKATALSKHLDRLDVPQLKQLVSADIPFVTTIAKNKLYKKTGKFESVEEQQQIPVQKEPQDNQQALNAKDKEIESLKGQITVLRQKVENEKNRAVKPVPNPETGEVPLTIGLANKLLKDKEEKERKEKKEKENSEKIKELSKETRLEEFTRKFLSHLKESDASDKAKSLGLDYMSFGRYGKDGKVTHKSVGGSLQALSKKDQEKEKEKDVTKTPKAEPKKSEPASDDEVDIKIKSRNFLKDFENGNFEDDEGFPLEIIFDRGESGIDGIQSAIDKAQEMGLEDLANDLDDVAYHIVEYEPDVAQAKYQDLMAKYSGKPVKAVEYADKVDKAVMMMSDQTYTNDPAPFANDLMSTMSIVKKMVDSDKTEGSSGSGMSNGSKGFRPEVIDTLQSLSDIADYAAELEKGYKGKDEKVREILGDLQGEIYFITDEDSDHDNYTKSYKVNSVVDTIIDMAKELQKRLNVKKESVNYPEGARLTYESIQAVKNKAEKTGMPYSILKQVYDRGMAAWRGGHRPGATQVQWALARVNSFVTKSSGTWGGADSDLAKKVKGSKN